LYNFWEQLLLYFSGGGPGILTNSPTSGKTIVLNITRLITHPNCTDDGTPDSANDLHIALTHTIPRTDALLSGEILGTGSWIPVAAGEVVGYLCKETEAVYNCKVNPNVPTHLAFQLRRVTSTGSYAPVQADVLGFLSISRCLYDTWLYQRDISENPTRQINPFHACPR
jgi:hypothetical protein